MLHELINRARRKGLDDEISFERAVALNPYPRPQPASPTLTKLGQDNEPFETPWGGMARLRAMPDPGSMAGIAAIFNIARREVVLSAAESCGLGSMHNDPLADSGALLFDRWHTLTTPRFALLNRFGGTLVADQDRETRIAELEAENTDLRTQLAELEAARPARARRKP